MRIAQITPGVLSIPPNGWGAVEKIIWEYTQVLRKLGHDVEILYTDAVVKGEWDVVHVHMANLALLLKERGIPYVFSHHDHHAFHYGKESQVYKQNREAILGSQVSFVHAKYLVDYFDVPGKIRYLGHGANLNDYAFVDRSLDVLNLKPGLVMMANNGLAGNSLYDRKGFGSGIEAARELDLPITIICREEGNKELIEGLAPYNKLNVLYNLDYKSSIEEINKNHIFLNPSMLEAGHPNLTVAESIAMGLPVVGTGESRIPGTRTVTLKNLRVDHFELASAIEEVLNSYSSYVLECKNQRGLLSWEVVVSRMLMDYAQYSGVTQKQLLIDSYESIELRKEEQNLQSGYYVRFRDNPYLYKAKETNSEVSVSFVDDFTGEVIHKMTLGKGPRSWISPGDLSHRFVQWRVIVKEGSVVKWESWMDLRNQHVLVTGTQNLTPLDEEKLTEFATKVGCFLTVEGIAEDLKSFIIIGNDRTPFYRVLNLGQVYDYLSPKNRIQEKTLIKFLPKALGDNIAFVPYANEFAKSLGKKVYVNCHHRELFEGLFDSIEFVDDVQCTEFILVDYLFDVPLQVGFSQQLGLEFKEIRPQVRPPRKTSPRIKGKYVCFSTHSTAQAKHWNNAGGWTKLCDELKKVGLIPVCIDRHKQFGIQGHWNPIPTNCLDQSGGDLDHMMSLIKECEFFIGLSSGLSWLAHAMGKRVVIISGVTNPQNEFTIDCIRMHRDDVCHSCFNRPQEFKFDPGNWLWCPIHFGTGRQFECTKRISAKQVMDQLKDRGWIYK